MKSKGLVGTLGVHINLANSGCVHSASSVCVTTKDGNLCSETQELLVAQVESH
jgi:hypothetical protein